MTTCKYCNTDFTPHYKHPNAKSCNSKRCRQDYKNEWAKQNPECKKKWILNNPEKRKQASAEYMKRNRSYYTEYASLRTRYMRQAKPKWLDEFQEFWIQELYHLASLRNLEVDHIVPLKNDVVCGLHVPWNMQLLTRQANATKNNKFDEDLVGKIEE